MSTKKKSTSTPVSTPASTATAVVEKKERVFRSKEDRIAELQKKIEVLKGQIAKHEMKIEAINNPKSRGARTNSMKNVFAKAKESGLTPEEIAAKLGIEL